MRKRFFRCVVLWALLGQAYYIIELIYRLPSGELPHPAMILVGGLCGVAVGGINQIPRFYNMKVRTQALIGTLLTLVVEFAAGCVLNLWLCLAIWDYSDLPLNLWGQICLLFAFAWFLLMPFAIWLEDRLRLGFGWNGRAYSLERIYSDFIKGK